ncbi:MAG: efflux RND transporter periplasmic adaptor subunit [Flavobacteriaceae bacterium]
MKNILKFSSLFIFIIVIGSCGSKTDTKTGLDEHGHDEIAENNQDEHGEEEVSSKITLENKQLEIMNIEIGAIEQISLGAKLKVNGQLELPPQNKASVSALIGGRVQSVDVIEGDKVRKGQVIARLSNPEFIKMQQEYLSAKSNISFLKNDYLRKKELLKDGITSSKSFQQSEAAYLQGKSNLSASKATLQLMGVSVSSLEKGQIVSSIPIIAPIAGHIQNVEINIGKFVVPEQEMFEIIDNEYLHLGLKVFEKDIDQVKVGQKVTFALTTRPDKIYNAEIFAVGKAFDMQTRAVKVHAKIVGNHEGLLTGMFVDARVIIATKKVDALPNEAFVTEKGLDYIFIQKSKDADDVELERIQVNRGKSDLGYSEIVFIKQNHKDTIVVVKGAYYVNAELNKGEFEEHEH